MEPKTLWRGFWATFGYFDSGIVGSLILLSAIGLLPLRRLDPVRSAASVLAVFCAVLSVGHLSLIVLEFVVAIRTGSPVESWVLMNRVFGPSGWAYGLQVVGLALIPHGYWFSRVRNNRWLRMAVAAVIAVGHGLQWYLVSMTLNRDRMPTDWVGVLGR